MNLDKNILEMVEYPKQGILSKEIFKNNHADCTLFCMASGTKISEHTSTKEGFVYVIEGKGIFNLQGEDIRLKEGVFVYMQKNAIHSLKADGDTSFLLILITKSDRILTFS